MINGILRINGTYWLIVYIVISGEQYRTTNSTINLCIQCFNNFYTKINGSISSIKDIGSFYIYPLLLEQSIVSIYSDSSCIHFLFHPQPTEQTGWVLLSFILYVLAINGKYIHNLQKENEGCPKFYMILSKMLWDTSNSKQQHAITINSKQQQATTMNIHHSIDR